MPRNEQIWGLLKKGASGVLASFPDLRAHKLGPLRAVNAHVLPVRSARKTAAPCWTELLEPIRS